MNYKCNLVVKTTITLKILMFMLSCCVRLRLMELERAAKIMNYAAFKGWLSKYKIDNGKWIKLDFNFEYEIAENESQ